MEGQGWVDNCTRIILERRHKPSTLIHNQKALIFWGVIHCKLYHFLYQKYSLLDITSLERVSHNIREAFCTYVSLCPSLFLLGQAALKFSLLQQLLINFTFLTTNHLPGPLILRQVFGGKFYLS